MSERGWRTGGRAPCSGPVGVSPIPNMRIPVIRRLVSLFLIVVLVLIGAAGTLYGRSVMSNGWSGGDAWRKSVWRLQMLALKAKGDVPNLSWSDLWHMTTHRGGFGLERVPREMISLDGSVQNPYVTKEDFRAGERMFRQYCSACHGGD